MPNIIASGHASGTSSSGLNTITGVGGALSLMGCVREASPPTHHVIIGLDDFTAQRNVDTLSKGAS